MAGTIPELTRLRATKRTLIKISSLQAKILNQNLPDMQKAFKLLNGDIYLDKKGPYPLD
jgi:hypothetical protein